MKQLKKFFWTGGLLLSLVLPLVSGCKTYRETFTKFNPDGTTNHVFTTTYRTCFIVGRASALSTSTQTEDYIRTVSADSFSSNVDSDAIVSTGGAVGNVVGSALKSAAGVPK